MPAAVQAAIAGPGTNQDPNLAAFLVEPGTVELRCLPTPEPLADEVLIAVDSVGVCGSDVHYFEEGRIGEFVVSEPLILGHEAAGRVVARGGRATKYELGTRVAIEPGVPCRACAQCLTGQYNLCPSVRFLATPPVHGAFARYLTMPEDFCFVVPDSVSDDAAALLEPTSVAVAAVQRARVSIGTKVLVLGAGPVGVLVAFVASAAGGQPTLCDIQPARLAKATDLGLERVIDLQDVPLEDLGEEFDCLVECSGAPGVLARALPLLKPRGLAVAVGMSADDDLRLPLSVLQTRELFVTGTFRYANTYPTAVGLAARRQVPLDALVGAHFGLDEVEDALRCARTDPAVLKAVVRPNQTLDTDAARPRHRNGGPS